MKKTTNLLKCLFILSVFWVSDTDQILGQSPSGLEDSINVNWCDFSPGKHFYIDGPSSPKPPVPSGGGSERMCGSIRLLFPEDDGVLNTGFGSFSQGGSRRDCACEVMEYVQEVIDFPSWVNPSDPLIIELTGSTALSAPVLGQAFLYYRNEIGSTPGFYSGHVYNHMMDAAFVLPSTLDRHGEIRMNFSAPFYYSCDDGDIDDCQIDFKSVILHEFTHLLGVGTLIIENPEGVLRSDPGCSPSCEDDPDGPCNIPCIIADPIFASNVFSNFDRIFTYYESGGVFNKLILEDASGSTGSINPLIPTDLFTDLPNNIWLKESAFALKNNQPIYSRSPFLRGASLQHFDQHFFIRTNVSPGFAPNYVMNQSIRSGAFKDSYTKEDLRMLRGLGYFIDSSVGLDTNIPPNVDGPIIEFEDANFPEDNPPAGNYDLNLTTTNCNPVKMDFVNNKITIAGVTVDRDWGFWDDPGDYLRIFPETPGGEGQLFNLRGCGDGTGNNRNQLTFVGENNNIVLFTPREDFVGRAQFGFHLYDGIDRGAFIVVTIDVTEDPECFDNGIEHVINGNLEEGSMVRTETFNTATLTYDGIDVSNHYLSVPQGGYHNRFADGQQYINADEQDQAVGQSWKLCYISSFGTLFPFGFKATSFDPGIAPLPEDMGVRMTTFNGSELFHQTMAPPLIPCNNYDLNFDISFWTITPVGTVAQLQLHLRNEIDGANLMTFGPFSITKLADDEWYSTPVSFFYDGSIEANFIVIDPITIDGNIFIDNISVQDDPTITITSPTTTDICLGEEITLTATGASTYLWEPGGFTTPEITVSPTETTEYTVTGYSPSGECSGISTQLVNVNHCTINCDTELSPTPSTHTIPEGSTLASNFPGTGDPPLNIGSVVDVFGDLIIDENTTYEGIRFRMAEGTAIRVNSQKKLTLNHCHLYSCTALWQGIVLAPYADIRVENYCVIEDAEIAIDWNVAGKLDVSNSIFNKNRTSIELSDASSAYGLTIDSSFIICRELPNAAYQFTTGAAAIGNFGILRNLLYNNPAGLGPEASLYPPADPETRSEHGVLSNGVETIIGESSTPLLQANFFDNLDYGIKVLDADLYIENNVFVNCSGHNPGTTDAVGIGILAQTTLDNRTIEIGGYDMSKQNKFKNNYRGAQIEGYVNIDFIRNEITNTQTSPDFTGVGSYIGNIGLSIFSGSNDGYALASDYNINNNEIKNCATGVYINRFWWLLATDNLQIQDNLIDATGTTGATYCNEGIWMQDGIYGSSLLSVADNPISITQNTIKNCEINAMRFDNVKDGLLVHNNDELSVRFSNTTFDQPRQVIRLNSCDNARIKDNHNIRTTGSFGIPNNSSNHVSGIFVHGSPNSTVTCNSVKYVDRCLVFDHPCLSSIVQYNTMNHAQTGLHLANGGNIGVQGSTSTQSGNKWGAWTDGAGEIESEHTYVLSTSNVADLSTLFCQDNSSSDCSIGLKTKPCQNNALVIVQAYDDDPDGITISTGLPISCPEIDPPSELKLANVKNPILFSGSTSFVDAVQLRQKRFSYRATMADTSGALMADTLINNFFYQQQSQVIGQITLTENLIRQHLFQQAKTNNRSMTASDSVESNHQFVYDKTLQKLVDPHNDFTVNDLARLDSIANLCVQESGEAVTLARSLLASLSKDVIRFQNACDTLPGAGNNSRKANDDLSDMLSGKINIYPNPNNGQFIISLNNMTGDYTVTVTNLVGQEIYRKLFHVEDTNSTIELDGFSNGIYIVKLTNLFAKAIYSNKVFVVN